MNEVALAGTLTMIVAVLLKLQNVSLHGWLDQEVLTFAALFALLFMTLVLWRKVNRCSCHEDDEAAA